LNPSATNLLPVSNGINFLGYVNFPDHAYTRRRVVNNLIFRLRTFKNELTGRVGGHLVFRYPLPVLERLLTVVNSYLAHFSHANSYTLVRQILVDVDWIHEYLGFDGKKAIRLWQSPRNIRYLGTQWTWFKQRYVGSIVMFQVGRFYEFYGNDADTARYILGCRPLKPRFYNLHRCGIPVVLADRAVQRVLAYNKELIRVDQTSNPLYYLQERMAAFHYVPVSGGGQ